MFTDKVKTSQPHDFTKDQVIFSVLMDLCTQLAFNFTP